MADSVVIFGAGAPSGVGGALTRRFAAEGFHVLASGRTLKKVQSTVDAVVAAGGSAEALAADVTSAADQDAVFARLDALDEPLAAVIFNAGANLPIPFEDLTEAQFEEFWRIGCFGAHRGVRW